jgi:DNA invertase Pin-like site-specific DNA recombinase
MGVMHARETVLAAFEMNDAGVSVNRIRRALSLGHGTVQRWLTEPKMNPYLDEIAIERAVKGDMPVFDALTYFEREEVLQQISAKSADIDFPLRFGKDAHRIQEALMVLRERDALRVKRAEIRRPKPRPKGVTIKKRSPELEAKVVALSAEGKTQRAIAAELGVSPATVTRVLASAA